MEVYLKAIAGGKTLTIRVSEDAPVKHLMWRIEQKEGIHLDNLRIIAKGKQWEYDRLLSSYDVQHESLIHYILSGQNEQDKRKIIVSRLDMDQQDAIYVEQLAIDTTEKAFLLCSVDQKTYDLYLSDINICETEWDFDIQTENIPYRFRRKYWQDRHKVLFTFKNHEIGLPDSLKRELIFFL